MRAAHTPHAGHLRIKPAGSTLPPPARRSPWTSTRAPPSRLSPHRGDRATLLRSREARVGSRSKEAPPPRSPAPEPTQGILASPPPSRIRTASTRQSRGSSRGDVSSQDPEAVRFGSPRLLHLLHSLTHRLGTIVALRLPVTSHFVLSVFLITAILPRVGEVVSHCDLDLHFPEGQRK